MAMRIGDDIPGELRSAIQQRHRREMKRYCQIDQTDSLLFDGTTLKRGIALVKKIGYGTSAKTNDSRARVHQLMQT